MGSGFYSDMYDTFNFSELGLSAFNGFANLCCCGPVLIILAVVLAIVGGAIYAVAVLKVK